MKIKHANIDKNMVDKIIKMAFGLGLKVPEDGHVGNNWVAPPFDSKKAYIAISNDGKYYKVSIDMDEVVPDTTTPYPEHPIWTFTFSKVFVKKASLADSD